MTSWVNIKVFVVVSALHESQMNDIGVGVKEIHLGLHYVVIIKRIW